MVLGIQLFGVLFALFMIYINFLNYKRKEFTIKEHMSWLFLWAGFIVVAVFPEVLDPIVKRFKFARTLDLLIVVSFIFVIGSIFYTYTIVRKNQKKIEELVRKIAFEKKKK